MAPSRGLALSSRPCTTQSAASLWARSESLPHSSSAVCFRQTIRPFQQDTFPSTPLHFHPSDANARESSFHPRNESAAQTALPPHSCLPPPAQGRIPL